MDKNGHCSSHPIIILSFLTVCLSKMSSILVGGTLHAQPLDPGFSSQDWHMLSLRKSGGAVSPFFPDGSP